MSVQIIEEQQRAVKQQVTRLIEDRLIKSVDYNYGSIEDDGVTLTIKLMPAGSTIKTD